MKNNFYQPFRIGLGVDHHRLLFQPKNSAGHALTLGGFVIPEQNLCLDANSDGDVIIHALCNAFSTAIGEGSLSTITDELCQKKGITNSTQYLSIFQQKIITAGYQISNISISLEAAQPKLEPYRPQITQSLANALNLETNQIGIAFTSGEKLTACGRGEGIYAQVICLLSTSKSA